MNWVNSGNSLLLAQRKTIIWANAKLLLIEDLGTNLGDILTKILCIISIEENAVYRLQNSRHFIIDFNLLISHNLTAQFLQYTTIRAEIALQHNEAQTKWPPFCRRHFQKHFRETFAFQIQFQ